jgi:recombination protein RecT
MQPQTYTTSTTPQARQQQAIQKVEGKTALDRIRQYAEMDEVKKRFINLLGDRDGKAYVESVVIAVAANDNLQKCSPKSIMVSAMRAASLKLSVDPIMKQAHLVPFNDEATLIVDYHGLVQLSVNTGYYDKPPYVSEVYEGEKVKTNRFTGEVTIEGEKVSDTVIGWCGYFKAKNGTERWLYMTNDDLDTHGEKYSRGYNYKNKKGEFTSLWHKEPEAMRRKTVLRLLVSRWGNFSPQVQNVIMNDEAPIDVEAESLPEAPEVKSAPELHQSKIAAVSILTGEGNPDPVKDGTWTDFLQWKERAAKVNYVLPVVDRATTTEDDMREYLSQIAREITAEELSANAEQETLL